MVSGSMRTALGAAGEHQHHHEWGADERQYQHELRNHSGYDLLVAMSRLKPTY